MVSKRDILAERVGNRNLREPSFRHVERRGLKVLKSRCPVSVAVTLSQLHVAGMKACAGNNTIEHQPAANS